VSFAPHPVSSTAWPIYLSSLMVGELKTKTKKKHFKKLFNRCRSIFDIRENIKETNSKLKNVWPFCLLVKADGS
jgi:hypothetical protein